MLKKIIPVSMLTFISLIFAKSALAVADYTQQNKRFLEFSGLNPSASVGDITSSIIRILLSLLGMIFIILLVYAGYLWMSAAGNEDQVTKATGIIKTAVIGLIIVVAAYSITYFVFRALSESGAGGGGGISFLFFT